MKNIKIYILVSLLGLCSSCDSCKPVPTPTPTIDEKLTNVFPPRNNNLIITEQNYGKTLTKSNIMQLENASDGNIYFLGIMNSSNASLNVNIGNSVQSYDYFEFKVGKISSLGNLLSEKSPGFQTRYILPFTKAEDIYKNGLIIVGARHNPNKARILVYDNLLNSYIKFVNDEEDTWFNSIAFKQQIEDEYYYVAVGGKFENNTNYPYFCEIKINTKTQSITKIGSTIVYDFSNGIFLDIKINESNLNSYCSLNNIQLSQYSVTKYDENDLLAWKTDVNTNSYNISYTSFNSLKFSEEHVYITGTFHDHYKRFYFDWKGKYESGALSCIDKNGYVVWQTEVKPSTNPDFLNSIFVDNDYCYTIGSQSNYSMESSFFANGLISKFSKNTGTLISDYTVGNESFSSGLYGFQIVDNKAFAAGWTNMKDTTSGWNAWFLQLDL